MRVNKYSKNDPDQFYYITVYADTYTYLYTYIYIYKDPYNT